MAMKKGDDPADFTVDEVNEYLGKARDQAEVERIYAAEEAGKARVGILSNREVDDEDDEPDLEAAEAPQSADDTEAVSDDGAAPEEAAEAPPVSLPDGAWTMDAYGNPVRPLAPTRPYRTGQEFYPFEYVDSPMPDTIIPTEDVYAVINYMGSERKGSTLAYAAGTPMPRVALDAIADDDTGRNGPVRSVVE